MFLQVTVSTSGHRLLAEDAIQSLINDILPHATIICPNIPEALLLLSAAGVEHVASPQNREDLRRIAHALRTLGPEYVLLKGGHCALRNDGVVAHSEEDRQMVVDLLVGDDLLLELENRYQASKSTHGTGCSLACKSLSCSAYMQSPWC